MDNFSTFRRLTLLATLLALCVVVLGAYVRLSDAGLGCPDWPGCYGQIDVPRTAEQIAAANAAFPERPVEVDKAWKEMVHRYLAATLGLLIIALTWLAWRNRRAPDQQVLLPMVLLALVIFQGLLGMWTVTWQLKPAVVLAHLLGGLTTLALLWWLMLRQSRWAEAPIGPGEGGLRGWAVLGLVVVAVQIALGGWTSTNYAALACTDFPTCHTRWWPEMDFSEGFTLWRGLGVNYEFGVLDSSARVAIHMVHRLGAVVVLVYIGWLVWQTMRRAQTTALRAVGGLLALLLALQLALGIGNVVLGLPLAVAVAHNAGAALLVLVLVTLNHLLRPREAR
jgi:cytochrome c oxidase assembly protein subunit 15